MVTTFRLLKTPTVAFTTAHLEGVKEESADSCKTNPVAAEGQVNVTPADEDTMFSEGGALITTVAFA